MAAVPITEWSVDDCYNHLYGEPWVDEGFLQTLRRQEIDGKALLELTKEDLRDDFGIEKLGHVKSILRNIRRMDSTYSGRPDSTPVATPPGATTGTATPATRAVTTPNRYYPFGESVSLPLSQSPQGSYYNTPLLGQGKRTPSAAGQRFQSSGDWRTSPVTFSSLSSLFGDRDVEKPARPASGSAAKVAADGERPASAKQPQSPGSPAPLPKIVPGTATTSVGLTEVTSEGASRMSTASTTSSGSPSQWGSPRMGTLTSSSLNLKAAKAKGRRPRAREERDRQEHLASGKFTPAPPFTPGMLESERRADVCRTLFLDWTGQQAQALVPKAEVQQALQLFITNCAENTIPAEDKEKPAEVPTEEAPGESVLWTLQEFVTEVTAFGQSLNPTIFDDLVAFLYEAVGDKEQQRQFERRAVLSSLFGTKVEVLQRAEIDQLLTAFNTWTPGETWLLLDVRKYPTLTEVGPVQYKEFEDMILAITDKFPKNDFDEICFRLGQCLDTLQRAKGQGSNGVALQPSFREELQRAVKEVALGQPILLYGMHCSPVQTIEQIAKASRAEAKGFVVSDKASSDAALSGIRHNGMVRGRWIYLVVVPGYHDTDQLLRSIVLTLDTKEAWMVHPKFRIFVILTEAYLQRMPRLIMARSMPIAVDKHVRSTEPED